MKKIAFSLIVGALFLGNSSHLHAQIFTNGSFTDGFSGWTVVGGGDTGMVGPQVVTSGVTPPTGSTAALVQSTDGDSSLSMSASVETLDAALSTTLPSTTFGVLTYAPDNGQAIVQTFTLASEAALTFAYSYQTNDGYPYDSVGYVLDGVYTQLVQTPPYAGPTAQTAYVSVTPIALGAGTHTLGFVAYNTGGPPDSTSLYVTDVSVPEPGEWALMLLGCVGLVFARKFRAKFSAF